MRAGRTTGWLVVIVAVMACGQGASGKPPAAVRPPVFPVTDTPDLGAPKATAALARRLLGKRADDFTFEIIPPVGGRDVFEIASRDGKIIIRGNNGVSMAAGLNGYLKRYCNSHVSLRGRQLNLPNPLPAVAPAFRRVTPYRYRYFLNYCCCGMTESHETVF